MRFLPWLLLLPIGLTNFGCGRNSSGTDGGGGGAGGSGGAGGGGGAGDNADLAVPDDLGGPCPPQMALVGFGDMGASVCVDRYEAATVEVASDGSRTPHPYDRPVDTVGNGLTISAVVAEGIKPQAYISEVQALAACTSAGKRLCKLPEWLAACQGPNGQTFPYGNTYMPGACNEGRATNPVNDCFGSGSNVFTSSNMNSPCCDDQPNTVAPGGSFAKCVSSWGIYDLHGNLHEWIDATTAAGNGIFKGGFFVDAKINGMGCSYATTAHAKSYHDYSTGFRCCADPR